MAPLSIDQNTNANDQIDLASANAEARNLISLCERGELAPVADLALAA